MTIVQVARKKTFFELILDWKTILSNKVKEKENVSLVGNRMKQLVGNLDSFLFLRNQPIKRIRNVWFECERKMSRLNQHEFWIFKLF